MLPPLPAISSVAGSTRSTALRTEGLRRTGSTRARRRREATADACGRARTHLAPAPPRRLRIVGRAHLGVEREDPAFPVEERELVHVPLYAVGRVTDLLAYRDRFPILSDCTYLINHSLAAMPAAAEDRLLEYARMWRERGIRAWGEGWWEMPITVGDQIGRIIGAPPGSTVMHQNVTVAEEVVLSCFREPGARNRVVYEEANFPSVRYLYQAKPDLEVVAVEDDAAIVEAIDERTLLVPISPRAVQERGDPGRRADRPARARGRCVRRARLLPVGRRRAVRRDRARRRLRRRRQRQMAVRRAGRGLAVRAAGSRGAARADVRRLAGPRAPVRVRAGARVRGRCAPLPDRHAERARRSTRRPPATT